MGSEGIRIWDLQSGELKRRLSGIPKRVRGLAFSPDRQLLAGSGHAGDTGSEETVRIWDAAGKERFAAPAGSVYFLDQLPADLAESLCDNPRNAEQGWGCFLKGAWADGQR